MRSSLLVPKVSIFILALAFLQSCLTYEDVEFAGMDNVSVNHINMDGASVAVTVKVKNPNNYKIKITKSDLDLYLGDRKVGKAKIDRRIVLKGNSSDSHTFNIDASFGEMGSAFGGLFQVLASGSANVKVDGWVKAKAFGIGKKFPVEFSDNVKLPSGLGK